MSECIFCKIVEKAVPARILYEDEHTVAFHDLEPQAPVHFLVVPRRHLPTLNDAAGADEPLLGRLFTTAAAVAGTLGIAGRGWRAVVNVGPDAQQLVFHVHLHVMGGRKFRWPPG